MHPVIDTFARTFGVHGRVSRDLRRAAAVVAIGTLGLAACDKPLTTSPVKPAAKPSLDASSGTPTSNQILIDNFTDGGTTVGGPWWGYWVQTSVSGVIGGTRELGSYNYGQITIDPSAGDMEWGLKKLLSPQFSVSYGTGIGIPVASRVAPDNNTGPQLHLSLTPQDQFVVDLAQITSNEPLQITVVSGNGEPFVYQMPMPATVPVTSPVELSAPLSAFISQWTNQPLSATAAADIDGFNLWQHGDGLDGIGGTKFTKLSITRAQTEFTSGSGVMAYDPLPGGTDPNWPTDVCTTQPAIGKDDPRWANPHPAYVLAGHPWAGTIPDAPWINAWNDLSEAPLTSLYPTAGFTTRDGVSFFNWSKYTTTVSGNGTFELDLLADNCSWVYLDNTLVGVQGTDLSKHAYGVTLNGTATLTFLIFDGGGLAGGQFRLVTTSNPPAPLVVDNTPPVITPTVTGIQGAGNWYTSDVDVSWSVTDPESAISGQTGCTESKVTTNTAGVTFTCSATSAGGTSSKSVTVMRDNTQPTVTANAPSGTLGNNGWYTTPVGVSWTVSAAGPSGLTPTGCAAATLSSDNAGITYTCSVVSGAGLTASASQTVKLDQTLPVVTFAGVTSYTVDQTVNITCSAADAMSGVFSSTCANTVGDAFTFGVGAHNLAASATDNAGNVGNGSAAFSVSVTSGSLCALVNRWVGQAGIANSMCQQLANGAYGAFRNHVSAQSDKSVSAAHASILIALSKSL